MFALYRADGGKGIGMGHLFRATCIAKQLLQSYNIITRIISKENEATRNFIEHSGLEHLFISENISVDQEINLLQEVIEEVSPLLFFLDVLEEDTNKTYVSAINQYPFTFIAITDASFYRPIEADIILNGNPNQISLDYSAESGKYLIGPKYFIMAPEYGATEVRKPGETVRRVLVTLGGSDHNDLMFRLIDALNHISPSLKLMLITSENTGYLPRLREYMKHQNELDYELHADVDTLINYWSENDVAISAGGNTLFERIATRIPGATVCQLTRQMEIADAFEGLGVNSNIGFGPELTDDELENGIRKFISNRANHNNQFQRSPDIVSGDGLILLIQEIGRKLHKN
ncbi:MAG TPA: hypothetical protein EYN69_05215 [Flavobacteriales bacterium]|nr:hypothetical protein [Flavobacteriales bacterium]